MSNTRHRRILSIDKEGTIAELHTSSYGVISIEIIRASSNLHTLSESVVFEIIVRTFSDASLGGSVNVVVRRGSIGTNRNACSVI